MKECSLDFENRDWIKNFISLPVKYPVKFFQFRFRSEFVCIFQSDKCHFWPHLKWCFYHFKFLCVNMIKILELMVFLQNWPLKRFTAKRAVVRIKQESEFHLSLIHLVSIKFIYDWISRFFKFHFFCKM